MTEQQFSGHLNEIKTDRSSGAAELARRCLEIMRESSLQDTSGRTSLLLQKLNARADALEDSRPCMAPIVNLLHAFKKNIRQFSDLASEKARNRCADAAGDMIVQSVHASEKTAAHAAALAGYEKTVFTHSYSSTILQTFNLLGKQKVRAIISEARPLCEGYRLAEKLSTSGIPVTLITDAQTGLFIKKADLVLIGADTILPDFSAINKAGSYLLALAAKDHGVPFYVCSETFKQVKPGMHTPELEAMDSTELNVPKFPNVTVENIYFDITPARLITGWVNENGLQSIHP